MPDNLEIDHRSGSGFAAAASALISTSRLRQEFINDSSSEAVSICVDIRQYTPKFCDLAPPFQAWRRRTFFVRLSIEALKHIQLVHHQHNLPKPTNIRYKANRSGVRDDLPSPHAQLVIDVDFKSLEAYDTQISRLELELTKPTKFTHPQLFYRLQSVPGIGPVLALNSHVKDRIVRSLSQCSKNQKNC